MSFDGRNPLTWFISLIKIIRVNVLEKFILPGLETSYWSFFIGLAIAAIVITVLINTVRIGSVSYSSSKERARQRDLNEQRRSIRSSRPKTTYGKRVQ